MLQQLKKRFILAILLLVSGISLYATNDPVYTNSIFGKDGNVQVNKTVYTYDVNFLAYRPKIEKTYVIKNYVFLAIDEESQYFVQTDFTVTMNLEITSKDTNNVSSTIQKSLTVNYKKAAGEKYNSIAYYTFDGGVDVTVKVLSIDSGTVTWPVSRVLKLKNEIQTKRDWKFDCAIGVPNLVSDSIKADEWKVTWGDPGNWQTEFDLEWAWIDESAVDSYNTNNVFDINKVFENNGTRITTSNYYYRIPLLYDGTGRLYVRIRPAQIKVNNNRAEGGWVYGAVNNQYLYLPFSGHENSLNWQATTTFAEEGKRKSVVQYYDGSLRGRQTVTKDNTTGTTVVAESFYDYQGRAVIQVLPAPTINTIIGFTKNFNQFDDAATAKSVYDKLDINQGACSKQTAKLKNTSGAAQYYSPNNPLANQGFNKFIPDANGYAYSETRYTYDGTGRVDAQGGVGETHQINKGHDTKYFYQSPDQAELDALFGTDAGVASHYAKNWVRDANGQYSVNYVDMHGRTVATSLAGDPPSNLQALPSYATASKQIIRQLIDNETNNVVGKSIVSSKALMVPKAGSYSFNYNLSPDKLSLLNCQGTAICYDCQYELNISIIPDCSETVIPGWTNPLVKKNFTLGQYLNDCLANNGKSPLLDTSFTVPLQEGSYTIIKELKLNGEAQNYYRDSVFKVNNTCKTLQDYTSTQYNLWMSQQNCEVSCASCKSYLGTLTDFTNRFKTESGLPDSVLTNMAPQILAAYNQAMENCNRICNNETDDGMDEIRAIKDAMLMDLSPETGQYANPDVPLKQFSIFNIGEGSKYKSPKDYDQVSGAVSGVTNYKDQFGTATQPFNSQLQTVNMNPQVFNAGFISPYANQLLWAHPEFCKLVTTQTLLKGTYRFAAQLLKTDTWTEAMNNGYITNMLNKDSFFLSSAMPGWAYRNQMDAAMNTNYQQMPACGSNAAMNISMWKMAQFIVFCRKTITDNPNPTVDANGCSMPTQAVLDCFNALTSSSPSSSGHCAADLNMVWKNFRSFYLSYRKAIISSFLESNCPASVDNAVNPSNRYLQSIGYQPRFITVSTGVAQVNLGTDLDGLLNQGGNGNYQAAMDDQADSTCRSNALTWITRLRQCSIVDNYANNNPTTWAADSAWMITNLVNVCKKGVDYMGHPFGASSLPASEPSVQDRTTGQQFRDFPQIVKYYLQSKGFAITAECHPYLIDYPSAYENAPPVVEQQVITRPSDCECRRISSLQLLYQQSGYPGTFTSYLLNVHGTQINTDTLNLLMQMCTTGQTATGCNFLEHPITLPPIFQCRGTSTSLKTCINCADYATIKQQFATDLGFTGPIANPQTQNDININRAFQAYANYKTGFHKLWTDYVAFEQQCNNIGTYTCKSLDSLLQLFYQSPGFIANPIGTNCQNAFVQYFNTAFNTYYTFSQWMSIFQQSCGTVPDVCKPRLTCDLFDQYLNIFYNLYGVTIYKNVNASQLFATWMNGQLGANYTYATYESMHSYLCGCSLNISSINCFLLTKFYNNFKPIYDNLNPQPDCQTFITDNFNSYFDVQPAWAWSQVQTAFNNCNAGGSTTDNNNCSPLIANFCKQPFSCDQLSKVLSSFYALYGTTISTQPGCQAAFTSFFNVQMATNYTFAQISALYNTVCGKPVAICQPVFTCKQLVQALQNFTPNSTMGLNCAGQFVQYFNNLYGTTYTYDDLVTLYSSTCGITLNVCGTAYTVNGKQMQQVLSQFNAVYPTPLEVMSITDAQSVFTTFFNQSFGTAYDYPTINNYYYVILGDSLHIFVSQCNLIATFVNKYQLNYANIKLPLAARQDLFAWMYNQLFYPGQTPLAFADIKNIVQVCNLLPANLTQETILTSLNDNQVLTAFKTTYYVMHPQGVPADCESDFANWVNRCMQTRYYYRDLVNLYNTYSGYGSGYICTPPTLQKQLAVTTTNDPLMPAPTNSPMLCGLNEILFTPPAVDTGRCKTPDSLLVDIAKEKYQLYRDSLNNVFDAAYLNKCLSAKSLESFTVTYNQAEYHYTLYYYDQAGNLVKTVPPAGVEDHNGDATFLTQVKNARANAVLNGPSLANRVVPNHTLVTEYRYNSLKQVIAQKTPDAGMSKFWYDVLGRLAVSQNAKQMVLNKYTYTLFDVLGRITEVGQLQNTNVMTNVTSRSVSALTNWLNVNTAEQITRTVYDKSYFGGGGILCPDVLCQRNLRNRLSYTAVYGTGTPGVAYAGAHTSATFYSYDIKGNIDTLLQDYNDGAMVNSGNRYKKIVYDYDQVTGRINSVAYQPNQVDAFYHRFTYNDENRLTNAETSQDKIYWEKDAKYVYYKHGPLSRIILGACQVQGIDFAYTLQGWLKGINSTSVNDGSFDIGQDGKIGSENINIARDVFGFSLSYFANDYKQINNSTQSFVTGINSLPAIGDGIVTGKELFNGNISSMLVNSNKLGEAKVYGFQYDELNRLLAMNVYEGLDNATNVFTPIGINDYKERITYDANGNINTYFRNGMGSSLNLNNYTYTYQNGNNRLIGIANSVNNINATYSYDEIGNVVQDTKQNVQSCDWNLNDKLLSVQKTDGTNISYGYDATGQRISKKIGTNEEWYVRDASGRAIATYTKDASINNGHLSVSEYYEYGNSLVGIKNKIIDVENPLVNSGIQTFLRGENTYFLSDNRGNTMVTLSDKKMQHSSDGILIDYFVADIKTATYYSAYGAISNAFNGDKINTAFNGQKRSTEISSTAQTALFWEYNGDVGRRWNIDPIYKSSISLYSTFGNNPILMADPLGDDWYQNKKGMTKWFEGSGERKKYTHLGATWNGYAMVGKEKHWVNLLANGKIAILMDPVNITGIRLAKSPNMEYNASSEISKDVTSIAIIIAELKEGKTLSKLSNIAIKAIQTTGQVLDVLAIKDMVVDGGKSDLPWGTIIGAIGTALESAAAGAAGGAAADVLVSEHNKGIADAAPILIDAIPRMPADRAISTIEAYNKLTNSREKTILFGYITKENLLHIISDGGVTREFLRYAVSNAPINQKDKIIYSQMIFLSADQLNYPIISLENIGFIPTAQANQLPYFNGFQYK